MSVIANDPFGPTQARPIAECMSLAPRRMTQPDLGTSADDHHVTIVTRALTECHLNHGCRRSAAANCVDARRVLGWDYSDHISKGSGSSRRGRMAEEEDQGEAFIGGLRAGDPESVRKFCDRYGKSLHQLADRHLP